GAGEPSCKVGKAVPSPRLATEQKPGPAQEPAAIGTSGAKVDYEIVKETGPTATAIDLAPHVGRQVELEARLIEAPGEAPPGAAPAAPVVPAAPKAKSGEPERVD